MNTAFITVRVEFTVIDMVVGDRCVIRGHCINVYGVLGRVMVCRSRASVGAPHTGLIGRSFGTRGTGCNKNVCRRRERAVKF